MSSSAVPMSPSQQGMYFDSQLRMASDYHVVLHLRIEPIEPERFEQAVRTVIAEQPALRAAVRRERGGVGYAVAEAVAPPVVLHDLRGREHEMDAIAAEAAATPFPLEAGPLLRIAHCKLETEDRVVLVCHHLVADGQSVSLLAERVVSLARGAADPRLAVALDTGFEAYQRKQAEGPSAKRAARNLAHWRESLARQEAPDLSHWFATETGEAEDAGRELRVPLDPALRRAISECAKEAEVSEYTLYLGVFGLLLGRYAHTERLSVAVPFADRPGIETEQSIGCFVKTLPVHLDVEGRQTMRALLEGVGREIVGGWKHLDHPLATLLGEYPALRRVHDVTFVHDSYPDYPEGVLGTAAQERVHFPGKLTVLVESIGERTELVFQYKESALTEAKAARFAARYLALLELVPDSLDAPVSTVVPPLDAESEALLAELDATHYYDWEPRHLGEVFLEKTAGDPARIAWVDDERDYSNAWAHDAAVLVQRRVLDAIGGTGRPVAILLPRSANLLAALFGTVLAGSPYVPLAAGTPAERLAQMLADADVAAVLTASGVELELPAGVARLDLDTWTELAELHSGSSIAERPAAVERGPADALYIEYTSGSTGQPKGVVVTHANAQNTALDLERRFPLRENDVYLLKTAFTFDIFGTEAYGWLFGAGRLAILPVGHEGDAPALLDAVREHRVTHLNCSPTLLRVLLEAANGRAADLAGLRYLFSGGEALTGDIVERFFALDLRCSLENVYGPTEATMWATHGTVTAADTDAVAPIGKPLNDYRILVLDPEGRRRGVDEPGEVCIAGAGVAVGYLNRAELNATQFVANPHFDPEADPAHMARMYRTGDLGYLREDGRFAFIRRIDRQVKVGGVRMELGEIERALLRAEGVVEAAVLVDDTAAAPRLAGFFTAPGGVTVEAVRESLARTLMPNMIPSPLVRLDALPVSAAGKLDRRALKELLPRGRATAAPDPTSTAGSPVRERVAACWRNVLGTAEIDAEASFFEQGGNSLSLMSLQQELREAFGREPRITELLKHHSVAAQARLLGETAVEASGGAARTFARRDGDVAIIGIGIQVPGAVDVQGFWENLRRGEESITFYGDEELRALGVPESDLRDPAYVKAKGRIADVDCFDDALFGIAPAEVDASSPQLRLLYKCFWQACEDAGYDPRALPGRVGVFAGGNDDFAWYREALSGAAGFGDAYQNFTLATNHFLSTRLSYLFDLKGPSMSSLSGCSTSLLTVHQAVQSLRAGECDLAVAGGATLELPNEGGYRYVDGMMLSPDGHCRPFDADANGTVFANGAALLVLKPIDAALRDGDPVYAVIKGSAVGNDGGGKPSFTAPSEDGQYEVIRAAYETSGIDPASVTYVEAHGTGTLLGDPIEVASLTRVFAGSPNGACLLGSVKGNIGHTDSAAGAVGLSKVALSLKHRYVPGTRGFERPNPAADFASTPFRVSGEGRPWRGELLRAGVNSFGVGGTNVHMIVEQAPGSEPTEDGAHELLRFSAASPEALERTSERVVRHLAERGDLSLSDAALTLRAGRAELPYRKTIVAARGEDRDAWAARLAAAPVNEARRAAGARTALLFSGQGNQHHRMGLGLYRSGSAAGRTYRRWMDELAGHLPEAEAAEFRELLFGEEDDGRIHRTEWSQFALFSSQYAMAKVLESFGVAPDLLIGHSVGELTAAALAGVWSLEDAARLVRERGRLMQAQRPGIMLAATAPADRVRRAVEGLPEVWVSLDNSAERAVLGMAASAFDAVVDRLEAEGIGGTRLHTSHAFHTPMMTGAAEAFAAALCTVASHDPVIPIVSNRTGRIVAPGEMTDPAYWSEHLTEQVRFAEGLRTVLSGGPLCGIELGPGRSLSTFAQHDPQYGPEHVFVNALRHPMETAADEAHLLAALGTLWGAGLPLDWSGHDRGRRISLPGYVFDRTPHKQDLALTPEPAAAPAAPQPAVRAGSDALQAIRAAFTHVLGHREVAAEDDFFALGGDSLKATGLAAHLADRAGLDVTVADLFAAPTPAALAARFEGQAPTGRFRKAPPAADHPLSPAQTRMYIAAKMDPEQLVYNMPSATLLRGTLDPERVRTALARLVERHEPLRATFALRDGEIRQRVADHDPDTALPLRFTTGAGGFAERIDAIMADFVRPFDLERGPLFRMSIVEGEDGSSLLLFDLHHIIADAVSAEVLSRDFSALYGGELEPLEFQYTDYVAHERGEARAAELARSEAHLLETLADAPTGEVLTPDHPRGQGSTAADRVDLRLGAERVAAVKALAERHQATPFAVLLAAWGAVLARCAEREDLVIGAPVTGRTLPETREMVGMFVNMMPIRLRPEAGAAFGDYLDRTRASVLDGLAHQDVPFDRLVERLGLARTPGRHPLFDLSFDYHNIDHHEVSVDGIAAAQLDLRPLAVGMDLVITCVETGGELAVQLDYAADLFARSRIEALAGHFDAFLARVCADDSLPLARIPLYSESQHAALLPEPVAAPFTPIHELIAARAAAAPEAVAVIDGDGERHSYARIDGLANAQAARLREAGLRVGEPVALFAARDVNLLIAQLAILKAGGAYVPLDPAQPPARHAAILADVKPRFAFAPEGVAAPGVATVFDLGTCKYRSPIAFEPPEVGPDDPIYLVYTSGSTGVPKGIAVRHRGVLNLFRDHAERDLFGPGDTVICLADPTFDIFTFESLLPLASGASVHMCPAEDQKDAVAIASRIADCGVTHIQTAVSKMAALCGNRRFRSQLHLLRAIVCGGEHFPESLLELLQAETRARVFNMYGPTETTVTATVKEFAPGDAVTIGSAISGASVLVVNEHGLLQPDGVPGELCIAGEGLGLGYTNNPEQQARAFTTIAELPDVPVYRTGDVGARLANGEIILKGRLDHQVKLSGNRIELGEIEQTAMRAAGVSYAVAAVEDEDLVLYYTAHAGADPADAIRAELERALPVYMRPGRYRLLKAMPKLHNGKVDRKALRGGADAPEPVAAPAAAPPATAPVALAPSVLLEGVLLAWEAVLGAPVRPTDNFFDVGGNSYKLMLVNNRLETTLGLEVPLVRLFEHPTPQSLADALGQETAAAEDTGEAITLEDITGSWALAEPAAVPEAAPTGERKIAVIGMAGLLPGAASIAEHWDNRAAGIVSVARFTREELLDAGIDEATVDDPRYVNARGFVEADTFDADFFGYSASDAEAMDPQARLLHETAWHALEDAGYASGAHPGEIGLFVGSGTNFAWMAGFLDRKDDPIGAFEAMTLNEKDFLATRIAYKLGLTGPAVNVQTACSTSLVAIHEAVRCLRQGGAAMALAGGVALNFPRKEGYAWHEGMIFSEDGECRPFSQDANGTVAGQGCGIVVLKPLDKAIADGDHVYAVIAGSAANNDGDRKVGYTAPSAQGQREVIRAALADAGVRADEVGYVETHGTGTDLGDPIEYGALASVYGRGGPCALGAVKANIGHLDAAAGVAGFIGAVGVLARGEIPPMANFTGLNANIAASDQLYVPSERTVPAGGLRSVAVSSFGIGGTNAHVVLEAAPPRPEPAAATDEALWPVSARTEDALRRMREALDGFQRTGPSTGDVSFTLARGRAEFDRRAVAVAVAGRPLEWIEAAEPPAWDAADRTRMAVSPAFLHDDSTAAADFRETVERDLRVFDEGLREALWKTVFGGQAAEPAVELLAQFVIRLALLRVAGPASLHAPAGSDRLARVAEAFALGLIDAGAAVKALRSGAVPAGLPERTGPTPTLVDGPIAPAELRRVLAVRWAHGGEVDRIGFCANGRRVPLPGYAFERRRFVSDIRLSDLGRAASAPALVLGSAEDALREAWTEVLGTAPADGDDFLQSGGDSLSAVRLCALVERRTGVALTVGEVFADAGYGAIRALLAEKKPATPEPPAAQAVPPVLAADTAPASPAQQRMYAVCALQNDTTAYNLAIAYRVTGELDAERLRAVLRQLAERHDQLRTGFHLEGGALVQRVIPEAPDLLAVVELTEAEARERLAAEPRPFDLAAAPLMRVEALAVDGAIRYLLIDMHHIIGDQTSLAILADDLARALRGEPLAEPPLRYAEYTERLAALERAGEFDADVAFFTELLADDLPRLELPADRNAPEDATFDGDRHHLVLTADRQAVAELARRCGATPYMVFAAGLTRLLGLYSGQREFVIGTAVSGRSLPGTDRTVGMFANTLPLKVADDATRTVAEAIGGARDDALAVLAHQNAPFDAVLSALDLHPGGETHPLFDVLFNYVSTGTEELELDGVRLDALPPGRMKSRYALSFSVAEREADFSVDIEYRTELFDAATIARLAGHLDRLLLGMAADPERTVAALRLESDEEHERRRAALTAAGPAIEDSLLDRVRASFARHAAFPALRWDRTEWTYAEVDRITDAIAGGLQANGIGEGDFVLCLLERGPWQVFTRVALMKCGAVEIPLDAATPADRIAQTLEDSGATTVLCSDLGAHAWPEGVAAHRPEELRGEYAVPAGITAASPLIMIYTSGTTGRPKGTLVPHGGILSTCVDNGYMDYAPGERILHLTGYTFDPSLLDIYSAFLSGATLVMGRHELNMDVKLLADFLRNQQIDRGILITAVFHLLMAEHPGAIAGMSTLYVGGEAMQPWAAERAFAVLGPGGLYNLYGPTEASVCTTYFRVDEQPEFQRMPIGVPARGRELFIVHPDGTDVPRGVPGELCVAGPSVAIGYHRRPELTAEKFTDTLGDTGKRLYRTGDRVVLDDEGRIVYLDRIDRQVKHAGYRIELSEIEVVLQTCPGVTEAVVVHTTERNDSRLTAFYTGDAAPAEQPLREYLLGKLPRYMVPQRLHRMRELPLTSHGKVDRKLLAAKVEPARVERAQIAPVRVEPARVEPAREPVPEAAPSADANPLVLTAFREVLGVPDLAAGDDFFLAGAQSLQAIAVIRRLRESGLDVEVGDLYRHPTAARLAAILRPVPSTAPAAPVKPLKTVPAAQLQRMVAWAVEDAERVAAAFAAEAPAYRFDLGAVARLHRASGAETGGLTHALTGIDPADAQEAVAAFAIRHEAFRTRFEGDRFEVLAPEAFAQLSTLVPVLDLRRFDRAQVRECADALARGLQAAPFTGGLLWRCVLVQESEETLRPVWAFHHGIFDGFSAGIVRSELPRLARGERFVEPQRYSEFLRVIAADQDWGSESEAFDYRTWLEANRAVTDAATTAPLTGRASVPLGAEHPLKAALKAVHERLSALTGETEAAIGLVTDCRRWKDEDFADCVGEFLDVVPVLLRGRGDQSAVADRVADVQDRGVHFVHTLFGGPEREDLPKELRAAYRNDRGRLDLVLVNFQGRIDPADVPEGAHEGPSLATAHVNVWHDDESLHLEWLGSARDAAEQGGAR